MPRPIPTPIVHFTRVEHLATIIGGGLVSDTRAQQSGMLQVEIGHHDIKERRRHREVPVAAGGVVADYVPFYFAPRSPMLYVIERGSVPTYDQGCDGIIYLVTTTQRLVEHRLSVAVSDRNAVLAHASIIDLEESTIEAHIDWALMASTYWNDTPEAPDRKERRMARSLGARSPTSLRETPRRPMRRVA
jgi:hypothetical protein